MWAFTLQKNCVIYFIEGPLKMMKNAFYFILKALSFSRYLRFCLDFFGHVGKTKRERKELLR